MVIYRDTDSFKNTKFVQLKDSLLSLFTDKNIAYNIETKEFNININENLKGMDISLDIYFKISEEDILEEVRIQCSNENNVISEEDLELYYLKQIFKPIHNFEEKDESEYVIRVYKSINTDIGFIGEYTVNFDGTKICFKNLYNEIRPLDSLTERIVAFDCKVKATDINKARSKALSKVREFTLFLSVVLDVGFFDIKSRYLHTSTLVNNGFSQELYDRYIQTGFADSELKVLVRDNFNHLKPFNAINTDYNISSLMTDTNFIANKTDDKTSFELEKIFKNRKFPKVNMNNNKYSDEISEKPNFNSTIEIPKNINIYFKNIAQLDDKSRKLFLNSCKQFNISSTYGLFEPTMQLAYLVSAIDCLIRADNILNNLNINNKNRKEKSSYSEFVKLYLGDDYDKETCDFLYEYIRNGHFHAGESFFLEDEIDLNLSFNPLYSGLLKKYKYAIELTRKVIIRWIYKYIINKDLRDSIIKFKELGLENNVICKKLEISEEYLNKLI